MARRMRSSLLILMAASLAVGWRADPPANFQPVNMTLDASRLFVSDAGAGVRIYDVSDPAAPAQLAVVPLRGNRGNAVKDGVLFANEYSSLVVLREESGQWTEVARLGNSYDYQYIDGGVFGAVSDGGFACACATGDYATNSAPSPMPYSSSYATFALIDDILYRVDHSTLVTYDVSDPAKPVEIARSQVGWEIESIYPAGDLLFIGGRRGMYVFDRSDPAAPRKIGLVEHFQACDPVVVSGNVAYVTLRGGGDCGEARDALLCVDIADPAAPKLIVEKTLPTPFGLVVHDPHLYVGNGNAGFTLLDVARPEAPAVLGQWAERAARDFIWRDGTLFAMGDDGVHVFDVSDPLNPVHLATAGPAVP